MNQLKGMNILLSADEHYLGRAVEERFRVFAQQISGKHCKIYKDTVSGERNRHEPVPVFFKDTRFVFLLDISVSISFILFFLPLLN
jgi:hypothetical protein